MDGRVEINLRFSDVVWTGPQMIIAEPKSELCVIIETEWFSLVSLVLP